MNLENKNTLRFIALTFILFPILVIAGMYMRTIQANLMLETSEWFYPAMTLHGVGMAGIWWVAALAAASRRLARHVKPSEKVASFAFYGTIVGVLFLLASVLFGRFAAGWYFLYPLPFHGQWPQWATMSFLLSITILGAVWLIWTLDILMAISKKYKLSETMGWHYIAGKTSPDVPPIVTISTVSLIAAVACLLSGVIALVLFYFEMATGTANDALLMKNLTFLFGHLLVNLSMYLAVGVLYDVFPEYTGREWGNNKIVAIAWNAVFAIVLLAYFHHLYMDFVQPTTFQYLGQIASYMSSLPSAIVTAFGAAMIVYRAKIKWNLGFILMFFGILGWGIGGIGAVIDSTISVNLKFHNTLWVPAHFHTYMIEGLVLMVLGYFYHYCQEKAKLPENLSYHKIITSLILIGGYGFLFMFYLSGAESVPRRFAFYPEEVSHGATYSLIGLIFITFFLIGLILYIKEVLKRFIIACKN